MSKKMTLWVAASGTLTVGGDLTEDEQQITQEVFLG
jgi:hypothetical protein